MSSFLSLYNTPLATGRQFALIIKGAGASSRKKEAEGTSLELMQVKASLPVYASLGPSSDHLLIQASGEAGGSKPQVYFLPWAKRTIYRIRPKVGIVPGLNQNLFFTPNLDGCMVTIEGTQEAPTIYHSNTSGSTYSLEEESWMSGAGDEDERNRRESLLKINRMIDSVHSFSKVPRKTPIDTTGHTAAKSGHFDILEYDKGSKQTITPNKFDNLDMDQTSCYGAIFGVRKEGKWQFYKQSFQVHERAWDALETTGFFFKETKLARKKIVNYTVNDCRNFWP